MALTPMMQQYLKAHEQVPDALLFFRMGDFYEMFFDDAIETARVLELTLTGRDCGLEERAPMCGVPHHAAENYIAKLVEKGYKVAICEQVEDPATAKGIVKREIVRVVSPGTVADGKLLDSKKNNYLMSVYKDKNIIGLAYLDVSTGDFFVTEFGGKEVRDKLTDEVARIRPAELLISPTLYKEKETVEELEKRFDVYTNLYPAKYFELAAAEAKLKEQFDVYSLTAVGLEHCPYGVRAAGALLKYLDETQYRVLSHINHVSFYKNDEFMVLDHATRKNLELTETLRSGEKRGSLLWVLDATVTAMGGRMLRRWLEAPLLNIEAITSRQNKVEELYNNPGALPELKTILRKVYDLERLCGKISFGSAGPRDLLSLKQSLAVLPTLAEFFASFDAPTFREVFGDGERLVDIHDLLDRAIADDAPLVLKDGGVIKAGYDAEINEYREAGTKGKDWIIDLERSERERTGIKSLKVKYNRVFGYFIEVTKSNLDQVPEEYIRKQTLANAERYFTEELKEMETKILGAEEKMTRLEYEVFQKVREEIIARITDIQACARDIAECDAIYALAQTAIEQNYVKPVLSEGTTLEIVGGRHPVVETIAGQGHFVRNDTALDESNCRIMLITGPNMAGKSTYIRQVAIITLLAQIGSFVPAETATIGVVDRIFTRVGASDDLATGQSTFMVEMTEVSNILKNATAKSLVILDEIGRGTSTFDGISIAWSVVEYLWDKNIIGAKTLFATHYHELTELESLKEGIQNFSIGVKETADGVVFLRKIKRGSADQSYGIEVAKLAGFPRAVTNRAQEILGYLEQGEDTYREGMLATGNTTYQSDQVNFFEMVAENSAEEQEVLDELKDLSIDTMTPMEAMNRLYGLKTKLGS